MVVTGGSKGLGCCLAEIYAMKGAGVAVLEKHGGGGDEEEDGIKRYKCDVGDRKEVEQVWRRVVEEVSHGNFFSVASMARWKLAYHQSVGQRHFDTIAEIFPMARHLGGNSDYSDQ